MRSGIDSQGLALLRLEQVEKAKANEEATVAGNAEILPQAPAWDVAPGDRHQPGVTPDSDRMPPDSPAQ